MTKTLALLVFLLAAQPAFGGVDLESAGPAYIESASAAIASTNGDVPYSIAVWVRPEAPSVAAGRIIFSCEGATNRIRVYVEATSDVATYESSTVYIRTTNSFTMGEWSLLTAVAASATDRYIVLDAAWANRGLSTTNTSPVITTTGLGISTTSNTSPYDGSLAYLTIWSGYALTQGDIESLYAGAHPLSMHPDKIKHFWPLAGDGPATTRARDMVGGLDFDLVTGTPTKTDSPLLHPFAPYYGTRLTDPMTRPQYTNINPRCREEDYRAAA